MTRMVWGASFATIVLTLTLSTAARAQNAAINDIKTKIFDVRMVQQTFAGGLRHCRELDGNNFYLQPRDRVINLTEFHRSLDSLALQGVFNSETRRPWNQQDADARWDEVRKQAVTDKANCALVASLPELQKKLGELETAAADSQSSAPQGTPPK